MFEGSLTPVQYGHGSGYTPTCAQEARRGSGGAATLDADDASFLQAAAANRAVLPGGLQACLSPLCSHCGLHVCTFAGRKNSFRSWPDMAVSSINPIDLAEQGFFYTGEGRRLRCVACGLEVELLKSKDSPLKIHKQRCPHCQFVGGTGTPQSSRGGPTNGHNNGSNDHEDIEQDGRISRSSSRSSSPPLEPDTIGLVMDDLESPGYVSPPPRTSRKEILKRENERLKRSGTCRSCKNEKIQTLFLPCRHLLTCEKCAEAMERCLKCNAAILGTVRTYFG